MQAVIMYEVKDFDHWKKGFDSSRPVRKENGATGRESVYRDAKNPNKIVLVMDWDNMENFEKFNNSSQLKEIRKDAGLKTMPETIIYEKGVGMPATCTCHVM